MSAGRRGRRWSVVAVGLVVTVGAACSSDGPSIEKADLIARGDQVCREARDGLALRLEQAAGEGQLNEAALIRDVLLPGVRAMYARVEELGTPSGDADVLHEAYDRIDRALVAAAADDASMEELDRELGAALADLRAYGFVDCAEDAGAG